MHAKESRIRQCMIINNFQTPKTEYKKRKVYLLIILNRKSRGGLPLIKLHTGMKGSSIVYHNLL